MLATYRIKDLTAFTSNFNTFLDSVFEWEVPNAGIASGWQNVKMTGRQLLELCGTNRGPNLRPDGFKAVRFLSSTDPRFEFSDHALYDLDTRLGCLGTRCPVEFERTDYVLIYDGATRIGGPTSGAQCWRDGHMAPPTPLVPCKWVRSDDPAAGVAAYDSLPVGYVFKQDELVRAYVTGALTEQFFAAKAATALPAPTVVAGDTNWRHVNATEVTVFGIYRGGNGIDVLGNRIALARSAPALDLGTPTPMRLVDNTTGNLNTNPFADGYTATDYIIVEELSSYSTSMGVLFGAYYDEAKDFLRSWAPGAGLDGVTTSPPGAVFVRLSVPTADYPSLVLQPALAYGRTLNGRPPTSDGDFQVTEGFNVYDFYGRTDTTKSTVGVEVDEYDFLVLSAVVEVPLVIRDAVAAGTFSATGSTIGEMTTTTPVGSRRGHKFKKAGFKYEFMPNDAGTADVWVRSAVG